MTAISYPRDAHDESDGSKSDAYCTQPNQNVHNDNMSFVSLSEVPNHALSSLDHARMPQYNERNCAAFEQCRAQFSENLVEGHAQSPENNSDVPFLFSDTLVSSNLEQARKDALTDSFPSFTKHEANLENLHAYYLPSSKLEGHAYKNIFYADMDLETKNSLPSMTAFSVIEESSTDMYIKNSEALCNDSVQSMVREDPSMLREKKIMRYRAKRSKRDFSRIVDIRLSAQAQMRERDRSGHFLPSKKNNRKTKDILKLGEEQEKLRGYFESTSREILALKQVIENQQRQIEALKRHQPCGPVIPNEIMLPPPYYNTVYETMPPPPSFQTTTPNSSTEAKSILSYASMNESDMVAKNYAQHNDDLIMVQSDQGSIRNMYHHSHDELIDQVNFDPLHHNMPENRLQEKLKKLGGPPSDIYHPWSSGMPLQHPIFTQKEDWQNHELRPVREDLCLSALGRERLDYIIAQQRWKQEQLLIADQNRAKAHAQLSTQETEHYWPTEHYTYLYNTGKKGYYKGSLQEEYQLTGSDDGVTTIPTPTASIWREAMKDPDFRSEFKFGNDG